jgi:hypothetical protein
VQPEQVGAGFVEERHVQWVEVAYDVVAAQWVGVDRVVPQPVHVPAPDRREPGVEAVRRLGDAAYDQVLGQRARQPPGKDGARVLWPSTAGLGHRRQIDVDDLATCVDAGVGTAGAGEPWRFVEAEHAPDPAAEITFDGTQAGLCGPAGEGGAVVGDVEPPSDKVGTHRR